MRKWGAGRARNLRKKIWRERKRSSRLSREFLSGSHAPPPRPIFLEQFRVKVHEDLWGGVVRETGTPGGTPSAPHYANDDWLFGWISVLRTYTHRILANWRRISKRVKFSRLWYIGTVSVRSRPAPPEKPKGLPKRWALFYFMGSILRRRTPLDWTFSRNLPPGRPIFAKDKAGLSIPVRSSHPSSPRNEAVHLTFSSSTV